MSKQSNTLPTSKTAYDVISRSDSDPISRLNGVHSSLDLTLIVLENPDTVDSKVVNDLYNTLYLLSNIIDQVENDLEKQLSEITIA